MIDIMNKKKNNEKTTKSKIKSNQKSHYLQQNIRYFLIVFDGRYICNQTNGHKFKPLGIYLQI